ncbi:MAG: hypothetical protein KZQ77_07925 [Candidatus Thiodiazotropha sp. (ex Notomyrtea botanica)]|nr:hypothetical protein [Candidatus Thiodiazotropha sp. (ex Notomyrtea botanica)]
MSSVRLWGLLLLTGCGGDPTAANPWLVYEDGFLSEPSEVEILAEGGTRVRGLDAWLKFQPRQAEIEPRNPDAYRYRDCDEPLAWFKAVTGDQGLQGGFSGLLCQEAIDPRFDFENGRWLVTDRNRGFVYYRIWKKFK